MVHAIIQEAQRRERLKPAQDRRKQNVGEALETKQPLRCTLKCIKDVKRLGREGSKMQEVVRLPENI